MQLSAEHDGHAWRTWEGWMAFLQPEQVDWAVSLRHAHRQGGTVLLFDGRPVRD